ncbi:aldo/keto reductase [Bacteroides sp.]|uniref:aldo/keto reductase n=1 Tax=Bacteroides sp. TaxID=29523 RepID=UPI0025B8D492|nr:aldo/keto reductase [Bacteroides sp.]
MEDPGKDKKMTRRKMLKYLGAGTATSIGVVYGLNKAITMLSSKQNIEITGISENQMNIPVEYRTVSKSGTKLSTIGIGSGQILDMPVKEAIDLFEFATEHGINFVDLAVPYVNSLETFGKALKGRREKWKIQMHLGCIFRNGQYMRSRNLTHVKKGFEEQLNLLGTDYADFALIHYVDDENDFDRVFSSGIFDYARKLKEDGVIRHLGFASHNVDIANKFIEACEIDTFLFSINPAYDFDPVQNAPMGGGFSMGDSSSIAEARMNLYKKCEAQGIGIVVMKALAGGRLLNEQSSPFKRAMTIPQCLQYCFDRPAVLSSLVGIRSKEELRDVLQYYNTTTEERDYSFIADMRPERMKSECVYCNHCLPCPRNINIGYVSKLLDLAKAGDELAKKHYRSLSNKASDCTQCGVCEKNCPFGVNIRDRMQEAIKVFGR